jgi:hypothetical protein
VNDDECVWLAGGMALFPCQIMSKEEAVLAALLLPLVLLAAAAVATQSQSQSQVRRCRG